MSTICRRPSLQRTGRQSFTDSEKNKQKRLSNKPLPTHSEKWCQIEVSKLSNT